MCTVAIQLRVKKCYNTRVNTPDSIYLDYAAAAPVDKRVLEVMQPYFSEEFFNPSSPYAPAVKVRREYEAAKDRLAHTFGAKGDEVVITAGATESINLAFNGIKGDIITSKIEHSAVISAAKHHGGVVFVKPTEAGLISAKSIAESMTPQTELVSVQLANHELGTIQPLREIAAVIKQERETRAESGNKTPILFHSDASQGFGSIDVHIARLGVDMLTLNSGKIYGPKQVGLLWHKPSVQLSPLIFGGGQGADVRSGTENVAGVIGFAKAAQLATGKLSDTAKLRDLMQTRLLDKFPQAVVSGHKKKRLPNFLHISFPGIDAERVIFLLEDEGVYVATGSACAASRQTKSNVLDAIGMDDSLARGSLRLTLGRGTTSEMVNVAIDKIVAVIESEYMRLEGYVA